MQHVVEIAFDFDDEKARKAADSAVENEMDKIIREIVIEKIAPKKYDYYHRKEEPDWSNFNYKVDTEIRELLDEHKEEIIERAASKLVESLKRTKVWKEKYSEVLQA